MKQKIKTENSLEQLHRCISRETASTLMTSGWSAADLHVHTMYSYDVMPTHTVDPLVLYDRARKMGMRFVVFTDHDTMQAYDQIGWTREGLVPAVEVKILDRKRVGHTVHINVYGLDRKQFQEIGRIAHRLQDIEALIACLKDQGLPYIFNHPFWHEPGEKPNLQAVLDIAELFPVLEYNMGRVRHINEQAMTLAMIKRKGIVATTDSHIGDVGRALTFARSENFNDYFAEIKKGAAFIMPQDMTIGRMKFETHERIRDLFDQSGWLFPKRSFSLDTGIPILDALTRRLARSAPDRFPVLKSILQKILELISHTGLPASLYIQSQIALAHRINVLFEQSPAAA